MNSKQFNSFRGTIDPGKMATIKYSSCQVVPAQATNMIFMSSRSTLSDDMAAAFKREGLAFQYSFGELQVFDPCTYSFRTVEARKLPAQPFNSRADFYQIFYRLGDPVMADVRIADGLRYSGYCTAFITSDGEVMIYDEILDEDMLTLSADDAAEVNTILRTWLDCAPKCSIAEVIE